MTKLALETLEMNYISACGIIIFTFSHHLFFFDTPYVLQNELVLEERKEETQALLSKE